MDLIECRCRDLNVYLPEPEYKQPLFLEGLECVGEGGVEMEVNITLGMTSPIIEYHVSTFKKALK